MLKHMLHSMQKVMTTDQAAEGLGEVELRDTVNAPVKEVHIYGKSVQAITTGAQLFDASALLYKPNPPARVDIHDGTLIINTEGATSNSYITFKLHEVILSGSTVTICANNNDVSNSSESVVRFQGRDGVCGNCKLSEVPNAVKTIVIPFDVDQFQVRFDASDHVKDFVLKPMLCYGSQPISWEPYTGGIPAPNPDYSQKIKSASGKIISTNNIKQNEVILPELHGIPVESGGNHTENNGQQWICDELILYGDGSGKLIQRVGIDYLKKTLIREYNLMEISKELRFRNNGVSGKNVFIEALCDKFRYIKETTWGKDTLWIFSQAGSTSKEFSFRVPIDADKSTFFVENPITIYYVLEQAIETPLTTDQLHTFQYYTKISAESEVQPHMKVNCLKIRGGGYYLSSILHKIRRWCYA